jgi:hypothetical protein
MRAFGKEIFYGVKSAQLGKTGKMGTGKWKKFRKKEKRRRSR